MLKQILHENCSWQKDWAIWEKAVQLLQGVLPVGVKIAGWGCSLLEAEWTEMDMEPLQTW